MKDRESIPARCRRWVWRPSDVFLIDVRRLIVPLGVHDPADWHADLWLARNAAGRTTVVSVGEEWQVMPASVAKQLKRGRLSTGRHLNGHG